MRLERLVDRTMKARIVDLELHDKRRQSLRLILDQHLLSATLRTLCSTTAATPAFACHCDVESKLSYFWAASACDADYQADLTGDLLEDELSRAVRGERRFNISIKKDTVLTSWSLFTPTAGFGWLLGLLFFLSHPLDLFPLLLRAELKHFGIV